MTDDQKWAYVKTTLSQLQALEETHTKATKGLMLSPESPLVDPFLYVCEMVVDGLERLVGDAFASISCYAHECDFGEDAKSSGISPDMRLIKTTEDLRWLVEISADK